MLFWHPPEPGQALDQRRSMKTVPIEALGQPAALAEALAGWKGSVSVTPGEWRGPGPGLSVVPDTPGYAYWQSNYQRVDPVPPLRCHFLRDVAVCGHGYLFHGEAMILQNSYLSGIALADAEAGRGATPGATRRRLDIDQPVLVVIGPGWQVYGHWLLDFLPRIALAQNLLGDIRSFKLLLPHDAPDFVPRLLAYFTTIANHQIIRYDQNTEIVMVGQALVPDYTHSEYNLSSFTLAFYRQFIPADVTPSRRICLSRKHVEKQTRSAVRFFKERALFEAMAARRGYEIVYPETLSLAEQIRLMAEAKIQIGEHGSAQHASLFSASGTTVGTIHPMNNIQMQIGRLCGQKNVVAMADRQWTDDQGIIHFTLSENLLSEFFDKAEQASAAP
jgi:hypothetical protein